MSIELNTSRVCGAAMSVMIASQAIGVALRELEKADQEISSELIFGVDPVDPDTKQIEAFRDEIRRQKSALLTADVDQPDCAMAMEALKRISANQRARGEAERAEAVSIQARKCVEVA